MGAFLSLLGGLSQGAGSAYGEIDKAKREEKVKNDAAVSAAILKELQTNDTLDQSAHEALSREYYKRMGVPNKDAEQLIQAHGHIWNEYQQQEKQRQARVNAQTATAPQLQGPEQTSPGGPQLPPTAALPTIPPPPYTPSNPTIGEVRFQEARGRIKAAETDKAQAAREAARQALMGTVEDQIEVLKKYKNTPYEQEVATMLKAVKSGGAGIKSRTLAGTMSGAAVKKELDAQGVDSSGIDPTSSYRGAVDTATGKLLPDSIHETEQQTRAGPASLGSSWIKIFPTDYAGNPTIESAMYVAIRKVNGGAPIGIYPVTELGSTHAAQNFKTIQMRDGTTALVPVTEISTTQKTANGQVVQNVPGGAQVAPPVPGPAATSTGVPAETKPTPGPPVPRTATPSTPLPKAPVSASARAGAPVSIPGAGRAFTPKETEDNYKQYQALATTADRVQQVLQNADLFKSLSSSGKIQLAMSPSGTLQVVSRYSQMNDRERHVAALLTSLKEDINTLRGVYQATGFRGPEAFAALTALAGKPLGDPGVTVDLLKQTLESLNTQRSVIEQALTSHGLEAPKYSQPSAGVPTKSLADIFGKK